MAYLTPDEILDKVQARITDQSSAARALCLGFLNDIIRDVINQPREWEFLKKSASLAVTANAITMPSDFGTMTSVQAGDYFFTPDEQLTDEEAFFINSEGGTEPEGYTISQTALTFVPGTTATTATLKYVATVADVADNTTATVFPQEFRNLLLMGTLALWYEYDRDDNTDRQLAIYQNEMKAAKALDNKKKAVPKMNAHGYVRERQ